MHNSNRQIRQATLLGKILVEEYKFWVLGFAPADVLHLRKEVWFSKLSSEQVVEMEQFLADFGYQ